MPPPDTNDAWQELRASDADREKVASQLRKHFEVGRLTLEELNERLDETYKARKLGQLYALTDDLPQVSGAHPALERAISRSSVQDTRLGRPEHHRRFPVALQVLMVTYLVIFVVAVGTWLAGYPTRGSLSGAVFIIIAALFLARRFGRQFPGRRRMG